MKKIILNLVKGKELKDALELGVESINKEMQKNITNSKIDISLSEDLKWNISNLLIEVYRKVQKANLGKIKFFSSETNIDTIKKLSEIQRELKHLNELSKKLSEKKINNKKDKPSNLYITNEGITKRIKILQKQIDVLQNSLSKFNKKNKISIKRTKKINLILEYIKFKI